MRRLLAVLAVLPASGYRRLLPRYCSHACPQHSLHHGHSAV